MGDLLLNGESVKMNTLANKKILLGLTGSIAAYKGADLVRRLRARGANVRVVMTRAACELITPLTMRALSGEAVHTELLDHDAESAMSHIDLARWCDLVVIAPASANFIARLAHGLADDLLSTLSLATTAPLLVAPAMNRAMWHSPVVQENIAVLEKRAIPILGPAIGEQACGETGPGRLLEVDRLVDAIAQHLRTGELAGLAVMVTVGPTREAIDPVRYISNHSSGRMGYAVVEAALEAGAKVDLISGPVTLPVPQDAKCTRVETADEMYDAVMTGVCGTDIFIAAAAVADYKCATVARRKIKKHDGEIHLKLTKNRDILGAVSALPSPPFTVGFAAETERMAEHAQNKLHDKHLDMIAANQVGRGLGFNTEDNALKIFWGDAPVQHATLERASKSHLARQLVHLIAQRYREKNSAPIPG